MTGRISSTTTVYNSKKSTDLTQDDPYLGYRLITAYGH